MEYVILDLEWNSGFSKKKQGYFNEIIEFGAVKLNDRLQETDRLSMLVRPEITKHLSVMVRRLTSLNDRKVMEGVPFTQALSRFRRFLGNAVLLSWSNSDLVTLCSNYEYHIKKDYPQFIKYYADLQSYCQDMLGLSFGNALSLMSTLQLLSVDCPAVQQHRALSDSLLASECFKKLYYFPAVLCYIRKTDDSFFDHLLSRNSPSSCCEMSDSLLLGRSFFNCCRCGTRCIKKTKWTNKNRVYYADYNCPACGFTFTGKLSFRRRTDGIQCVKHVIDTDETDSNHY